MIKDETGIALPLVIVLVLVATIIGSTLFLLSTTETRQVARDVDKMKAHYIARSGAHAVAGHFMEDPESAINLVGLESREYSFRGGHYSVEVIDKSDYDEGEILHEIISTGRYNGVVQRISVEVKNKGVSAALYADNIDIRGGGNAEITGGDVIFGGDENDPDLEDLRDILADEHEIWNKSDELDEVDLPCDDETLYFFSGCEGWVIEEDWTKQHDEKLIVDEDIRYDTIEMNSDYLEINAEDDNVLLKANLIDMGGNTPIYVKLADDNTAAIVVDEFYPNDIHLESTDEKGGFLLIYVNIYDDQGNSEIFYDDNVHLNVYVLEDGSIDLGGTYNFRGSIYAPDAKSVIFGDSHVKGWVIADEFEVGGGGSGGITYYPIKMRDVDMKFDFYDIVRWLK